MDGELEPLLVELIIVPCECDVFARMEIRSENRGGKTA